MIRGNNLADQEAKRAALMTLKGCISKAKAREECEICGEHLDEPSCYVCGKKFGLEATKCTCDDEKYTHCLIHDKGHHILSFTIQEKDRLSQMGIRENNGKWELPDGREVLPKPLALRIMWKFHDLTHWGTQVLVDQFANKYMCIGIHNIAK